jgi:hypothetical protein
MEALDQKRERRRAWNARAARAESSRPKAVTIRVSHRTLEDVLTTAD